ncbi:hypothetical protein HCH04_15175 [Bacteroides thetaiotaomicron]|uniref:hypothetical protein n=1 Tax=Bacteroides thetaiotaomicron TaxID=818 RepID=UPI001C8CED3E|nr:hypothetical protein [Bacteroides thetaiotaomicron]MBX9049654.1 hypothetical protein [Bacteroides thetaiotaomicron]MBX9072920.1 hypothetical protein [Bacteroides thetaiotaomicron]
MRARRAKTVAQQCRYYEVENIFEYMVSVYINGNITPFRELYKELCTDAQRLFIDYIFEEVPRCYHQEIIRATI